MAYCSQCGNQLDKNTEFCAYCGIPVSQTGTAGSTLPQMANAAPVSPAPPAYNATPPFYSTAPRYGMAPVSATTRQFTFIDSFLSIIVLAALLLVSFLAGLFTNPHFLDLRNLSNLFSQMAFFVMVAVAAAISVRAKGPDLSIGPMMGLSAIIIATVSGSSDALISGILLSLLICGCAGLINGVLTTYLKVPAIIATLLIGMIIYSINLQLTQGLVISVSSEIVGAISPLLLVAVTLVAAFLMNMLSKLGIPTYKREKKSTLSYLFAYMVSALIASLAGLSQLTRIGVATSLNGTGYEPFIFLVFGCITSSRILDNRFAPVLYAIAPATLYLILSNLLNLIGVVPYVHLVIRGILALIFIVIAYMTQRKSAVPEHI